MRIAMAAITAACAAFSTPALAAEPHDEAGRMAEDFRDPVIQRKIAGTVEAVTGAVLDTRIGPLMRAVAELNGEDTGYIDPDARLADMIGPEAADAPREFAHRLPAMMASMTALTAALEHMLPEMRTRIEEAMPPSYDY